MATNHSGLRPGSIFRAYRLSLQRLDGEGPIQKTGRARRVVRFGTNYLLDQLTGAMPPAFTADGKAFVSCATVSGKGALSSRIERSGRTSVVVLPLFAGIVVCAALIPGGFAIASLVSSCLVPLVAHRYSAHSSAADAAERGRSFSERVWEVRDRSLSTPAELKPTIEALCNEANAKRAAVVFISSDSEQTAMLVRDHGFVLQPAWRSSSEQVLLREPFRIEETERVKPKRPVIGPGDLGLGRKLQPEIVHSRPTGKSTKRGIFTNRPAAGLGF